MQSFLVMDMSLHPQADTPGAFRREQVIGHRIRKAGVKIANHPAALQKLLLNGKLTEPPDHLG